MTLKVDIFYQEKGLSSFPNEKLCGKCVLNVDFENISKYFKYAKY